MLPADGTATAEAQWPGRALYWGGGAEGKWLVSEDRAVGVRPGCRQQPEPTEPEKPGQGGRV